ncbi:MAG: glycosyltransferase [Candidatus Micrarchaeia archaeon]
MKPKLALVHPYLYTKGGAERVVLKIAQHFNAKIYCSIYDKENTFPEFSELDVEVIKKGFMGYLPSFIPKRARDAAISGYQFYTLKIKDYDVVNAHGTPSEWVRNRNAPVVWYCHTPNREAFDLYEWRMRRRNLYEKLVFWSFIQAYKFFEFKTVPKIEHVFANSENTKNRLKKYLGVDAQVLNPCVDYDRFRCDAYDKFFLYPSRITPEKRFEFAIEAFKKFSERNKGWKLVIAGALLRQRKEHVAYYEQIRSMLGDMGEIMLDVDSKTLTDLYARCTAVLYTPVDEDFGIVPLEAMASCKPCIAINEGGPKEVIPKEAGFLISSPAEMAEKMGYIANNIVDAEKMGKAGRAHVEKNFSWKAFLNKFERVVRQLARKPH